MGGSFVLDTSVVMTWCFRDETDKYGDLVLDSFKNSTGFVPSIWPLEVGNVLLAARRRDRISEADSARFISLLHNLPIIVEQESPDRMFREIYTLAHEHNLSSYDASYLDLAMRKGLPIATIDRKLKNAAEQIGIPAAFL